MDWQEQSHLADSLLIELDAQNKSERWDSHPHLTELIYCLTRAWYNRFQPLPATRKEMLYFVLGLGLQQSLTGHRESVTGQQDGIHYEIDFLQEGAVGELKTTRMALTKHPNDWSSGWHKQLLGYLKVLNTTRATYYVLYVIPPELKAWVVEASQEEIDANWEWLLMRKEIYDAHLGKAAQALGLLDELPPEPPTQFTYNEEWECKDCRYKLLCDARQAAEKYG